MWTIPQLRQAMRSTEFCDNQLGLPDSQAGAIMYLVILGTSMCATRRVIFVLLLWHVLSGLPGYLHRLDWSQWGPGYFRGEGLITWLNECKFGTLVFVVRTFWIPTSTPRMPGAMPFQRRTVWICIYIYILFGRAFTMWIWDIGIGMCYQDFPDTYIDSKDAGPPPIGVEKDWLSFVMADVLKPSILQSICIHVCHQQQLLKLHWQEAFDTTLHRSNATDDFETVLNGDAGTDQLELQDIDIFLGYQIVELTSTHSSSFCKE